MFASCRSLFFFLRRGRRSGQQVKQKRVRWGRKGEVYREEAGRVLRSSDRGYRRRRLCRWRLKWVMKVVLDSCGVCSYAAELNNRGAQHLSCQETQSLRCFNIINYNLNTCVRVSSFAFFSVSQCAFLRTVDGLCQYLFPRLLLAYVSVRLQYVFQRMSRHKLWDKSLKTTSKTSNFVSYSSKIVFLFTHKLTWEYFTVCVGN